MMIRRNVKLLVLGAALVLALPAVTSAQMSRVEGMALQGDYIKDWSGIFTYTSQVANVGNLVYGELGNVNSPPSTFDRSVGAVVGNLWEGRLGTWAVHLHEQQPNLGQGDAGSNGAPGTLGSDPNTNTMESFDIMWGKKFGTKSLGLRLNRSKGHNLVEQGSIFSFSQEYDFTAVDTNLARNTMGFGAGLGFEVNPTTNAEISLEYQKRDWKDETSNIFGLGQTTQFQSDGTATYLVAGRMMWQWQPNIMVVPVAKYYSYDLSEKYSVNQIPAGTIDNSLKGWQIGAAGNWTLGSNDLFVLGLTFAQNKLKQQRDVFGLSTVPGLFVGDNSEITETLAPQLFAALETHVNSWLTLRFGANKGAFEKVKITNNDPAPVNPPIKQEITLSTFHMNLGAGLKFGNLQLDAVLDNQFPNHLPYFISGDVTSNTFTKVTASYPW